MTKDELKKEVEEYLTRDYCCEFKEECKDGVRIRCAEYEAKLYLILRHAEPKLAELEKDKAYLDESLDKQIQATIDLQKENAELKTEKGCEICTKFDEVKLAQAKKIIKGLLSCCGNYPQENAEKIKQAEQFLKEIENE